MTAPDAGLGIAALEESSLGIAALEEGGRVDFGRLRAQRRQRCLAAMSAAGVDVLVLGRPANVRYVTGARPLWTAGTRGFGPGAVVVGDTGEVYLMSVWDEGVPSETRHDNIYGLSWNPGALAAAVGRLPGVGAAVTVGIDALSPLFAELLTSVAPRARLVDGQAAMLAARRVKTGDEVACLRTACGITEAGLSAMVAALRPGTKERELVGVFDERIAAFGVTTPAAEGICAVAGPESRFRQVPGDTVLTEGDLMLLSPGALYAGYEGGTGRTWIVGDAAARAPARRLYERWRAAFRRLLAACRPEETGANLVGAWTSTGEVLPPIPLVHGVGLGVEPPVIGAGDRRPLGEEEVLSEGMVLAVQATLSETGIGTVLGKETVLVTNDRPEVLSRYDWGPLAR